MMICVGEGERGGGDGGGGERREGVRLQWNSSAVDTLGTW